MIKRKEWEKSFENINGRLPDEEEYQKAVSEGIVQEEASTEKSDKKTMVIISSVLGGLLVVAIVILLLIFFYPKPSNSSSSNFHSDSSFSSEQSTGSTQESSTITSQSSSDTSQSLAEWNNLSLNEQIALLAQSYAVLNPQTTILNADKMAMTGDINNGTIEWYDSEKTIHKVNIKINDNVISYNYLNGNTGVTEEKNSNIDTAISTYYTNGFSKQHTQGIASKMVSPNELENSSTEMNLTQILKGDYSSIQDIWKSKEGRSLLFENNEGYFLSGEEKTRMIFSYPTMTNGCIEIQVHGEGSPAGAVIYFIPIGHSWADTDPNRDRIFITQGISPNIDVTSEKQKIAIQNEIYYRINE